MTTWNRKSLNKNSLKSLKSFPFSLTTKKKFWAKPRNHMIPRTLIIKCFSNNAATKRQTAKYTIYTTLSRKNTIPIWNLLKCLLTTITNLLSKCRKSSIGLIGLILRFHILLWKKLELPKSPKYSIISRKNTLMFLI